MTEVDLLREALRRRGSLQIQATGTSMLPLIPPGRTLTVRPCGAEDLRIGDVLLCSAQGCLLVHRFLGRRDGRLILKGDARARPDAPLPEEALLGRVTAEGLRWRLGQPLAVVLLAWPAALLLRGGRLARWGARLLPGLLRCRLALQARRVRRASRAELQELWRRLPAWPDELPEGPLLLRTRDAAVVACREEGAFRIVGVAGAELDALLAALALRSGGPWRWLLPDDPRIRERALACGFRLRGGELEKIG